MFKNLKQRLRKVGFSGVLRGLAEPTEFVNTTRTNYMLSDIIEDGALSLTMTDYLRRGSAEFPSWRGVMGGLRYVISLALPDEAGRRKCAEKKAFKEIAIATAEPFRSRGVPVFGVSAEKGMFLKRVKPALEVDVKIGDRKKPLSRPTIMNIALHICRDNKYFSFYRLLVSKPCHLPFSRSSSVNIQVAEGDTVSAIIAHPLGQLSFGLRIIVALTGSDKSIAPYLSMSCPPGHGCVALSVSSPAKGLLSIEPLLSSTNPSEKRLLLMGFACSAFIDPHNAMRELALRYDRPLVQLASPSDSRKQVEKQQKYLGTALSYLTAGKDPSCVETKIPLASIAHVSARMGAGAGAAFLSLGGGCFYLGRKFAPPPVAPQRLVAVIEPAVSGAAAQIIIGIGFLTLTANLWFLDRFAPLREKAKQSVFIITAGTVTTIGTALSLTADFVRFVGNQAASISSYCCRSPAGEVVAGDLSHAARSVHWLFGGTRFALSNAVAGTSRQFISNCFARLGYTHVQGEEQPYVYNCLLIGTLGFATNLPSMTTTDLLYSFSALAGYMYFGGMLCGFGYANLTISTIAEECLFYLFPSTRILVGVIEGVHQGPTNFMVHGVLAALAGIHPSAALCTHVVYNLAATHSANCLSIPLNFQHLVFAVAVNPTFINYFNRYVFGEGENLVSSVQLPVRIVTWAYYLASLRFCPSLAIFGPILTYYGEKFYLKTFDSPLTLPLAIRAEPSLPRVTDAFSEQSLRRQKLEQLSIAHERGFILSSTPEYRVEVVRDVAFKAIDRATADLGSDYMESLQLLYHGHCEKIGCPREVVSLIDLLRMDVKLQAMSWTLAGNVANMRTFANSAMDRFMGSSLGDQAKARAFTLSFLDHFVDGLLSKFKMYPACIWWNAFTTKTESLKNDKSHFDWVGQYNYTYLRNEPGYNSFYHEMGLGRCSIVVKKIVNSPQQSYLDLGLSGSLLEMLLKNSTTFDAPVRGLDGIFASLVTRMAILCETAVHDDVQRFFNDAVYDLLRVLADIIDSNHNLEDVLKSAGSWDVSAQSEYMAAAKMISDGDSYQTAIDCGAKPVITPFPKEENRKIKPTSEGPKATANRIISVTGTRQDTFVQVKSSGLIKVASEVTKAPILFQKQGMPFEIAYKMLTNRDCSEIPIYMGGKNPAEQAAILSSWFDGRVIGADLANCEATMLPTLTAMKLALTRLISERGHRPHFAGLMLSIDACLHPNYEVKGLLSVRTRSLNASGQSATAFFSSVHEVIFKMLTIAHYDNSRADRPELVSRTRCVSTNFGDDNILSVYASDFELAKLQESADAVSKGILGDRKVLTFDYIGGEIGACDMLRLVKGGYSSGCVIYDHEASVCRSDTLLVQKMKEGRVDEIRLELKKSFPDFLRVISTELMGAFTTQKNFVDRSCLKAVGYSHLFQSIPGSRWFFLAYVLPSFSYEEVLDKARRSVGKVKNLPRSVETLLNTSELTMAENILPSEEQYKHSARIWNLDVATMKYIDREILPQYARELGRRREELFYNRKNMIFNTERSESKVNPEPIRHPEKELVTVLPTGLGFDYSSSLHRIWQLPENAQPECRPYVPIKNFYERVSRPLPVLVSVWPPVALDLNGNLVKPGFSSPNALGNFREEINRTREFHATNLLLSVPYYWNLSTRLLNKLMHTLNGNIDVAQALSGFLTKNYFEPLASDDVSREAEMGDFEAFISDCILGSVDVQRDADSEKKKGKQVVKAPFGKAISTVAGPAQTKEEKNAKSKHIKETVEAHASRIISGIKNFHELLHAYVFGPLKPGSVGFRIQKLVLDSAILKFQLKKDQAWVIRLIMFPPSGNEAFELLRAQLPLTANGSSINTVGGPTTLTQETATVLSFLGAQSRTKRLTILASLDLSEDTSSHIVHVSQKNIITTTSGTPVSLLDAVSSAHNKAMHLYNGNIFFSSSQLQGVAYWCINSISLSYLDAISGALNRTMHALNGNIPLVNFSVALLIIAFVCSSEVVVRPERNTRVLAHDIGPTKENKPMSIFTDNNSFPSISRSGSVENSSTMPYSDSQSIAIVSSCGADMGDHTLSSCNWDLETTQPNPADLYYTCSGCVPPSGIRVEVTQGPGIGPPVLVSGTVVRHPDMLLHRIDQDGNRAKEGAYHLHEVCCAANDDFVWNNVCSFMRTTGGFYLTEFSSFEAKCSALFVQTKGLSDPADQPPGRRIVQQGVWAVGVGHESGVRVGNLLNISASNEPPDPSDTIYHGPAGLVYVSERILATLRPDVSSLPVFELLIRNAKRRFNRLSLVSSADGSVAICNSGASILGAIAVEINRDFRPCSRIVVTGGVDSRYLTTAVEEKRSFVFECSRDHSLTGKFEPVCEVQGYPDRLLVTDDLQDLDLIQRVDELCHKYERLAASPKTADERIFRNVKVPRPQKACCSAVFMEKKAANVVSQIHKSFETGPDAHSVEGIGTECATNSGVSRFTLELGTDLSGLAVMPGYTTQPIDGSSTNENTNVVPRATLKLYATSSKVGGAFLPFTGNGLVNGTLPRVNAINATNKLRNSHVTVRIGVGSGSAPMIVNGNMTTGYFTGRDTRSSTVLSTDRIVETLRKGGFDTHLLPFGYAKYDKNVVTLNSGEFTGTYGSTMSYQLGGQEVNWYMNSFGQTGISIPQTIFSVSTSNLTATTMGRSLTNQFSASKISISYSIPLAFTISPAIASGTVVAAPIVTLTSGVDNITATGDPTTNFFTSTQTSRVIWTGIGTSGGALDAVLSGTFNFQAPSAVSFLQLSVNINFQIATTTANLNNTYPSNSTYNLQIETNRDSPVLVPCIYGVQMSSGSTLQAIVSTSTLDISPVTTKLALLVGACKENRTVEDRLATLESSQGSYYRDGILEDSAFYYDSEKTKLRLPFDLIDESMAKFMQHVDSESNTGIFDLLGSVANALSAAPGTAGMIGKIGSLALPVVQGLVESRSSRQQEEPYGGKEQRTQRMGSYPVQDSRSSVKLVRNPAPAMTSDKNSRKKNRKLKKALPASAEPIHPPESSTSARRKKNVN